MICCGERMQVAEQPSLVDGRWMLVQWCQACGGEDVLLVEDAQLTLF